ncbi:MAG: 50S ribosomal protein L21 [Patescibacteria group bacterium]
MAKFAVIKTGGKQFVVKENDTITVDNLSLEKDAKVDFETLARFDSEKSDVQLGTPQLEKKVRGTIIENLKGDKVRVAKFKAKVRYRKVQGFSARLTKVQIITV